MKRTWIRVNLGFDLSPRRRMASIRPLLFADNPSKALAAETSRRPERPHLARSRSVRACSKALMWLLEVLGFQTVYQRRRRYDSGTRRAHYDQKYPQS